jgi:sulfonate transport system substrate-binding protein
LEYKLIRKQVDVPGWIDATYLTDALHTLKLENNWPRFDKDGKLIAGG